jgi:hypothetical protein
MRLMPEATTRLIHVAAQDVYHSAARCIVNHVASSLRVLVAQCLRPAPADSKAAEPHRCRAHLTRCFNGGTTGGPQWEAPTVRHPKPNSANKNKHLHA